MSSLASAEKMGQLVKILITKPDNFSAKHVTPIVEGEKLLPHVSFHPPQHLQAHTQIDK